MTCKESYGILRSWLMYYAKPFNRKRLKSFYAQFIQKDHIVFDIGAHLGNRSQSFLDLGAVVIALEPQPNCAQFLRKKFGANSNFTLIEKMVGKVPDEINFQISSASPTISTARDQDWADQINRYSLVPARWDYSIRRSVTTLDLLIKDYGLPSFCKIDVEGFEWEVIQGLSQPIPALSLEYLAFDQERMIKCMEWLMTLGDYQCNFSPGETQRWKWKVWKNLAEVTSILKDKRLGDRFGDFYFAIEHIST